MKKMKWENFDAKTQNPRDPAWSNIQGCSRLKVPGGWVLLHVSKNPTGIAESESMVFVPDAKATWDSILDPVEEKK